MLDKDKLRIRAISLSNRDVSKYLNKLEKFLGSQNIRKRIQQLEHTLKIESGKIYRRYWLCPQLGWWLGLRDALKLRDSGKVFRDDRISPRMRDSLGTAAKIAHLFYSMSESKRSEFKQRLLGSEHLTPVLHEIDVAAHFWQLGYDIDWVASKASFGQRTPEFIASIGESQIEVECKTKNVDSGRMIERKTFYRVADSIFTLANSVKLMGNIFITIPGRLSDGQNWCENILSTLSANLQDSKVTSELADGTEVKIDLHKYDNVKIDKKIILERAEALRTTDHTHIAFMSSLTGEAWINPLFIRLASRKPDMILARILRDLRDAKRQFSGLNSALICCFIPEIDSFCEAREETSAISKMTAKFFKEYSKDFIYAVSYLSDVQISETNNTYSSVDIPTLTFKNFNYNERYGSNLPLYRDNVVGI